MAKMLDFSKVKKPTMPVKFDDGTVIHIYTPYKGDIEEMLDAQEYFSNAFDGDRECIHRLYEITARLMSNNKMGREITVEELAGYIDMSDIVVFFRAYSEFIAEQTNAKN
jgi:hypothetical protein